MTPSQRSATPADKDVRAAKAKVRAAKREVVEVVDEGKVVEWHGVILNLPPKLPASILFDMAEQEMDGADADGNYAVHAIRQLLGPEQWRTAKARAVELNLDVDAFADFVETCYAAYGMGGSGESSASSSSSNGAGHS